MDFIDIIGTFYDNSINHTVALTLHVKDLKLNKFLLEINEDIYLKLGETKDNKNKGYYSSFESLLINYPNPSIGDWAIIQNGETKLISICEELGIWVLTEEEYKDNLDLNEYPKKSDFKTINNQSIIGEGDIELKLENILSASQELDGLMPKESYIILLDIKDNILPKIENDIENLQSILSDNTDVSYIINRYNQIKEFVESLGDGDENVLNFIISRLDNILNSIGEETLRALREEQSLKERLRILESKLIEIELRPVNRDSFKHQLISLKAYDSLESYEKNTLYLIVDFAENTSVFGDKFPFILGGNSEDNSSFGGTFPLTFGNSNYYIGSRFPIKFKQ